MANSKSWKKIFDDYKILEHDFNKSPFPLSAEQIKRTCQNFRKINLPFGGILNLKTLKNRTSTNSIQVVRRITSGWGFSKVFRHINPYYTIV